MKVSFFLLKFPLASETFVLNQIVAFINMGYEVEIVALHKGDLQNTHSAWTEYRLAEKPTGYWMSRRASWRNCAIVGRRYYAAQDARPPGKRSICRATVMKREI
jgi:colanic acid/amylovoran biosynthesis glycosyltransferase